MTNHYRETALKCTHIYIAYSQTARLFKIGITFRPQTRFRNLRTHKPALVGDWMCHWIKDVGQGDALSYETMIGRDLNQYRIHLRTETRKEYVESYLTVTSELLSMFFANTVSLFLLTQTLIQRALKRLRQR